MEEIVIKVDGMHCEGCVRNVTGVLTALAGVQSAAVVLVPGEARVVFDPALLEAVALLAAIEDAGFDAKVIA